MGQSKDVHTGEALASNLAVDGAFIMNRGTSRGANIGTLTTDKLIGNEDLVLDIGGDVSGKLLAGDIELNGGQINFDPPFAAAGDLSSASMGGLEFASSNVDARINVAATAWLSWAARMLAG